MQALATVAMRHNLSEGEIRVKLINLFECMKSTESRLLEYIDDLQYFGYIRLHPSSDENEKHYYFVSDLNAPDRIEDELFDYGFTVCKTDFGYFIHFKFGNKDSCHPFPLDYGTME